MEWRRQYGLASLLAGLIILSDQISKWWVVERLMRPEGVAETPFYTPFSIEVLPVLEIVMTWNRGVSFGMFNRDSDYGPLLLTLLAIAIVAGLVVWLRRTDELLHRICLGLIIGGAIGNVIDRIRWGAVADFIHVHYQTFSFPAFNVADSAISVGAILLVADALFARRDSGKDSA